MICAICGKPLTANQVKRLGYASRRASIARGPFCSRRCRDRDTAEQMGGKVALDNRPPPKALGVWQIDPHAPCPICIADGRRAKLVRVPRYRILGTCPECRERGCAATRGAFAEICKSCVAEADLRARERTNP